MFSTVGFLKEILRYLIEKWNKRLSQRDKITKISKYREVLFNLNFNSSSKLRSPNKIDNLIFTKPFDSSIFKKDSEGNIKDHFDDSMCTLGLDRTILFTKINSKQVLPLESIKSSP